MARVAQNVTIADLGLGNLHSVAQAFSRAGVTAEITRDPDALRSAEDCPAGREAAMEAVTMARTSQLAEKAQDQLSDAISSLMGLDPAAPAGTPGVLVEGVANVLIGGLPMPSGSSLVRGLLRLVP